MLLLLRLSEEANDARLLVAAAAALSVSTSADGPLTVQVVDNFPLSLNTGEHVTAVSVELERSKSDASIALVDGTNSTLKSSRNEMTIGPVWLKSSLWLQSLPVKPFLQIQVQESFPMRFSTAWPLLLQLCCEVQRPYVSPSSNSANIAKLGASTRYGVGLARYSRVRDEG
jgi:hypothetical protein